MEYQKNHLHLQINYGGMDANELKLVKELEYENAK